MTPDALRVWVRTIGKLVLGFLALLIAVRALNSAVYTDWFLTLSALIAVWYFADVYRTYRSGRWTLWWYYHVVNGGLIALVGTLGTFLTFLLVQGIHDRSLGWGSVGLLAAISIHQAYRGRMLAVNRWHSAADIMNSLRAAALAKGGLPTAYDAAFFGAASLLAVLLGRLAGAGAELMLSAVCLALSIPYILGMVVASHFLLRRYYPQDASLPSEVNATRHVDF